MKKKKIYVLLGLFSFLGLTLYLSEQNSEVVKTRSVKAKALSESLLSNVKKIELNNSDGDFTLELAENTWVLPERGGYPADYSRVRSLMFKLARVSLSSPVTEDGRRYVEYGVDSSSNESESEAASEVALGSLGKGVVSLYGDSQNDLLARIYLGKTRSMKVPPQGGFYKSGGQYVRFSSSKGVYLLPEPLNFSSKTSSWIKSDVESVLKKRIVRIEQITGKDSKVLFGLSRTGDSQFVISPEPKKSKEVNQSRVSLVAAALENLQIEDVTTIAAKDLNFDRLTSYSLNNGLRYKVSTAFLGAKEGADEEDRYFLKLEAELGEMKSLKAEDGDTQVETVTQVSPAEVSKINLRHSDWIYQVSKHTAEKFRFGLDEMFGEIEEESS